MDLGADLTEFEVIIGIAQPIRFAQRQPKLFSEIGEEGFVVQVGFRLGDDRVDLIELGEGQEDGRQIAEGLVQPPGLGRVADEDPRRFESIEHRMPGFVGDNVKQAARENPGEVGGSPGLMKSPNLSAFWVRL